MIPITQAIAAYGAVGKALGSDAPASAGNGGGAFGSVLGDVLGAVGDKIKAGEAMSIQAVADKASMIDVVTAINEAEMTLQTVVAVRDGAIQAYNEVMRMPI